MDTSIKQIIIIGAGIGGLSAAIALRKLGYEVNIYERAHELGDVGAGLTLWANALRGLRQIGLAEAVIHASARLERAAILNWRGKTLVKTDTGAIERWYGEPTLAIHRARLHRILVTELPQESIHLGADCTGFAQDNQGVTASFSSGDEARGDLMIGADGIHSTIRQQMYPQMRTRYAGYTAWRGIADASQADIQNAVPQGYSTESWGCGHRFGIVPLLEGKVYWFATQNTPEGQRLSTEENRQILIGLFGNWHAPIPALIESTPPGELLRNDILDFEPFSAWSQGCVTLLGDAAHATTPNMGQGACQAIESAIALAACLHDTPDTHTGLALYEARRQPHAAWITRQSLQIGSLGQLDHPLICALRNAALRMTPASFLQSRFRRAIKGE